MSAYQQRILRVCDFISQHLDDELGIDRLCEVAALSPFHFHRLFTAATGVSLARYVQLSRLRRASFQLAFEKQLKITDIAFGAGFDSTEGFTRAFRRSYGQTPSAFRRSPDWARWHDLFTFAISAGAITMDVRIISRDEEMIAYIPHHGPANRILDTAGKFIEWRKSTGLSPISSSRTYGIPYGDPAKVPEAEFRFDVCGSVNAAVPANDFGVRNGSIPAGRYAVLRHNGSHDRIEDSVYRMLREWLHPSKEELGDFPVFFQYLNFVHQVEECDLQTDIFMLLR